MVKTARAAGEIMGKFHPHEAGSIVGAMTKMSQSHSSAPTIMGIGNWGSWDKPPAAERYTSCYLSKYAASFFDKDELSQVPFEDSYDGDNREPRFLPAKLPHLLLHGCTSFGTGASGNIPPCEPKWVLDAIAATIEGKPIKLPTEFAYRWGGKLVSLEKTWVKNGSGSAVFRPTVRIDNDRKAIVITSLSPQLNIDTLTTYLENKVESFGGIVSAPSAEELVSISIMLRRGHSFDDLKKAVASRIKTRSNFAFICIEQIDGDNGEVGFQPHQIGPAQFLKQWVEWRSGIVVGAAKNRIKNLEADNKRQQLMIRVIEHRKQLLVALEQAKDKNDLKRRVRVVLKCSDEEADIVLAVQFHRLASLELKGIRQRITDNNRSIKENAGIARNPSARLVTDAVGATVLIKETLLEAKALSDIPTSNRRRASPNYRKSK
jgi:DNA gyrase/topoisomerase IV subunit A